MRLTHARSVLLDEAGPEGLRGVVLDEALPTGREGRLLEHALRGNAQQPVIELRGTGTQKRRLGEAALKRLVDVFVQAWHGDVVGKR